MHRTRAFPIQYLPIGCAPSARSFVLPRKHSIRATSRYHLLHAIYGATCCWAGRFPSSGRLCGSGTTGPNSAEHSSEQSVLKLDLFVSVHISAYQCICTRARFCRRTSYQQPETDVRNFSICKGKAPAPRLLNHPAQRNRTCSSVN